MVDQTDDVEQFPVIKDPADFDRRTGNWLERAIFNWRVFIVFACAALTVFLAGSAVQLGVGVNFQQMLPHSQPFIRNYLKYRKSLRGLGDSVRIVVQNKNGTIFHKKYLATLQKISDAVYLIPGVDRPYMQSLWTRNVRWLKPTAQGYSGGPVMPNSYNGSHKSIRRLRRDVNRSGIVGSLVATNLKSSAIYVPLMDHINRPVRKPLDYVQFSRRLNHTLAKLKTPGVKIHVIGLAQLIGDLAAGIYHVMLYFGVAIVIAAILLFLYTRCLRSSFIVLLCSVVAVTWDLGIIHLLGIKLDPYSVLVPFLVFAIGVSHGSQKMNGILQDIGRGTHKYVAARYTYRRLFRAGLTALLADATAFAVLAVIDIPVIRELALMASIGVGVLIFTNLILLPILLSFTGVSPTAARLEARHAKNPQRGITGLSLTVLSRFTRRPWAIGAIVVAIALAGFGFAVGKNIQVGDLHRGAPALWPHSRYNRDVAYVTKHYRLSNNRFVVIVKTPDQGILNYSTQVGMDRLEQRLRPLKGVQSATSLADLARQYTEAMFQGNPRWYTISDDKYLLPEVLHSAASKNRQFTNLEDSVAPILVYLKDHKARTLSRVVRVSENFARHNDTKHTKFLLAAGTAGIQAATNIAVGKANLEMLGLVYAAVILLCFITFRSWRGVIVAIIPLALTSVLCQALMVLLGIGVTVATLPVTALGVGIGVDYALYLLSVQLAAQRRGLSLPEAYAHAIGFTGKVVLLVGFTLATGLITWRWSPIKFQASMGVLLSFMFLWNMIGSLILIPALSYFLLRDDKVRQHATEERGEYSTSSG